MNIETISPPGISGICQQDLQFLSDGTIIRQYFLLISQSLKYVVLREAEIISSNTLDVFIRLADSYLYYEGAENFEKGWKIKFMLWYFSLKSRETCSLWNVSEIG